MDIDVIHRRVTELHAFRVKYEEMLAEMWEEYRRRRAAADAPDEADATGPTGATGPSSGPATGPTGATGDDSLGEDGTQRSVS